MESLNIRDPHILDAMLRRYKAKGLAPFFDEILEGFPFAETTKSHDDDLLPETAKH